MSGAVFLDFRKAFDLVHYDILLKKISTYNLKHRKYSFLTILLTGSSTMRACKWQITLPRNAYNKWTFLGPLLFCIFINDLPLCLTRASVQCDLFADDGTLNTANDNIDYIRRDLQLSLYDVSGWCRNRMALNPTKTKCMLMATRQKHQKKTAPFKSKVRDHANRAGFKTSPTWSNSRRTAKVANAY